MFKHLTGILLTFVLIFSFGCSTQSTKIWSQPTDTLVALGHYKKALSQLEAEDKAHTKTYKSILKTDRLMAAKKIEKIKNAITLKQWGKANTLLSQLIEHHNWNKQFDTLKTRIQKSSDNEKRLIETDIKLAQAVLLQSKITQYDFNVRLKDNDHGWSFTKAFLTSEKKDLATALYRLSIQALDNQDYDNAQKTYNQALQLNNDLQKYELSKTINSDLNKSSKTIIQKQQKILLKSLNTALANEDFPEIISLQNILSKAPFKGKNVKSAIKRSHNIRLKQAKILDQQADAVYRLGDIPQAIKLWKQAQQLSPGLRSLQDKLSRANKVQSKLNQLRNKN